MSFKNTKDAYDIISKSFHWVITLIILALILVGFYMVDIPYSPWKLKVYALHKSFGLLVLWLAGLRILWRVYTSPPKSLETHAKWEKELSKIIHTSLYIAMFVMPLSGWAMSSAGEYPVPFFGFQMPDIVSKSPDLAKLFNQMHKVVAYLLVASVTLHALGAFKHHFIDRNKILITMVPNIKPSIWIPLIILGLVIFALSVIKLGVLNPLGKAESTFIQKQKNIDLNVEEKNYNSNQWDIISDQSNIKFTASIYNKNFTATLPDFDGTIIFDIDNISASKADIKINLSAVNSQDTERDSQILGSQWFNIEDYPVARFETIEFQEVEGNKYIAVGNLSLAGSVMPISLPFALDIVESEAGSRAYVEGQVVLNRLDFDMGGEEWESPDSVGHNVTVGIRLVAENLKNSAN